MDTRNEFVNIDESQTQYIIENVIGNPFLVNCLLVIPNFEIAIAKQIRTQGKII